MYIRYGHVAVAVGLLIIDLVFIYEYEGVIKDDTEGDAEVIDEIELNWEADGEAEIDTDGDKDNSCKFLSCRFLLFRLRS